MKNKKIVLLTLSPKTHRTSEESLGIEYLKSSLVKDGFKVDLIDAWLNNQSVKEVFDILKSQLDEILFIGISSYMGNTQPSVDLIEMLKNIKPELKIVCGGFGPTFYPEEYLSNKADYVIRGEGEVAICEIAHAIEERKEPKCINNISYIKNDKFIHNKMGCLINDLDEIQYPARDFMDKVLENRSSVNVLTSRGCSGNCDFCSVISFFRQSDGKVWRTRSIDNIVDEIEMLSNCGVKLIKAVDDSFVDGIRDDIWCKNFADEINKRNINVKLRGQIRADKINEDNIQSLKRAGFYSFACGIENGSDTALKRMNKASSVETNNRALEIMHKNNYLIQMGFILFDDLTTYNELLENYNFLQNHDYALTKGIFSEMYSAKGTKFTRRLQESGKITESGFKVLNSKYNIDDDDVLKVYYALKKWHKSHSVIYDMTIDPLIAPKIITDDSGKEFYNRALELKRRDLIIFKKVLETAKECSIEEIDNLVNKEIQDSNDFYKNMDEKVRTLYKKEKLKYNAEANPYI